MLKTFILPESFSSPNGYVKVEKTVGFNPNGTKTVAAMKIDGTYINDVKAPEVHHQITP